MGFISVLWGIVAITAVIGIAVTSPQNRGRAKTGLVLNAIVIIGGMAAGGCPPYA